MKNRKLFVRTTKKCMIAIMSAMLVMTPVCASVIVPIGSYADPIPNNPAGTTLYRIEEGDTMEYNYGTVVENFGTIDYNTGEVRENAGTVNDNWGFVNNSDAADKPNLVVNNHTPGTVYNGNLTNNWGTLEGTVNVTNDNLTNDPHPTAPLNVEILPIVFDPEPEPVSDNQTDYEQMKNTMEYMGDVYRFVAKVQNIPDINPGSIPEKVYEIDMGRQINFNDKMLEALGVDGCKNHVEIHFFYEGSDYYLVIPYGASLKAAYDYVKENGMQGFMCIHALIDGSVVYDKAMMQSQDSNDSDKPIFIHVQKDGLTSSTLTPNNEYILNKSSGSNISYGLTNNSSDFIANNNIAQAKDIENKIKELMEQYEDYSKNPDIFLGIQIPNGEIIEYIPSNESLEDFIKRLQEKVPGLNLDYTLVE